jgi:hypothetical protein
MRHLVTASLLGSLNTHTYVAYTRFAREGVTAIRATGAKLSQVGTTALRANLAAHLKVYPRVGGSENAVFIGFLRDFRSYFKTAQQTGPGIK